MELKNMYYGVEMIKKLKEHLFRAHCKMNVQL